MRQPPCKDCPRRYPGCGCQDWKDWRAEIRAAKDAIKKDYIAEDVLFRNRVNRTRQY